MHGSPRLGSMGTMAETGRPSLYTPELAAEICRRLADGASLRAICEAPDMPNASTVHLWAVTDREGFSKQYADARRAQAARWADELLEIADDGRNDTIQTKDGREVVNTDVVQRSRLRVDTRKWLLSKIVPKVYGDRVAVEGADGGPIRIAVERDG